MPIRRFAWPSESPCLGSNAYVIGAADQTEAWTAEPAFPAVARRVRDMLVALERDGFVSFG